MSLREVMRRDRTLSGRPLARHCAVYCRTRARLAALRLHRHEVPAEGKDDVTAPVGAKDSSAERLDSGDDSL